MTTHVLEIQAPTTLPNARRPKPRSRAIGRARIEGRAEEGDVIFDVVAGEARVVVYAAEGRDAGEDGVGLSMLVTVCCEVA